MYWGALGVPWMNVGSWLSPCITALSNMFGDCLLVVIVSMVPSRCTSMLAVIWSVLLSSGGVCGNRMCLCTNFL